MPPKEEFVTKFFGFTLIELLVVIAIIGVLVSLLLVNLNRSRESAKIAQAVSNQVQLGLALQLYFNDMNFFPPDVNRGYDPGFAQPLPTNPDTGDVVTPACDHCPADWVAQVQVKWKGPYMVSFPRRTPWDGKYDYNYWSVPTVRNGCVVPPGIYFGVQGDYAGNHTIPVESETKMVAEKYDADGCVNGEAELLMQRLP
jgi:prepilin-type N-terminal cleavage/methylation domain-containing protein